MLRSEFSAASVARPSGWLTSTFRMAICRDTHNSTPQRETVSNLVLRGGGVGQFNPNCGFSFRRERGNCSICDAPPHLDREWNFMGEQWSKREGADPGG